MDHVLGIQAHDHRPIHRDVKSPDRDVIHTGFVVEIQSSRVVVAEELRSGPAESTDEASVLLGFGASAIGMLPQGYVQNAVPVHAYLDAIEAGAAAVTRGIALDAEDRLRRDAIERLMCDGAVDLAAICRRHGRERDHFAAKLARLALLDADGLVAVDGHLVRVRDAGRALLRTVCAVFDDYFDAGERRHARAI